jgi:hypothetical protein
MRVHEVPVADFDFVSTLKPRAKIVIVLTTDDRSMQSMNAAYGSLASMHYDKC